MGVLPSTWGPNVWSSIHYICIGSPEVFSDTDRTNYTNFIMSLQHVLPCNTCQEHLAENLSKVPLDEHALTGRDGLFEWSVNLHNTVNTMLNKKTMSLEDAKALWINGKSNSNSKNKCYIAILLLVIILLVVYILFSSNTNTNIKLFRMENRKK